MFEFTVPDGDYDYDSTTDVYVWKPLHFFEKKKGDALKAVKEFVNDGTSFTMTFLPKP